MNYAVKEAFYTLQGEGINAGRPAVFLRFSGCNLWSGREQDRAHGAGRCSRWCDTDFVGTDGAAGGRFDSPAALASHVATLWAGVGSERNFVVCTGGEPLLQLDEPLVAALHDRQFDVAVETNGTLPIPRGVDWVCVSPKAGSELVVRTGDELKLVVPQSECDPQFFESLAFRHLLVQPMDGPDREANTRAAVAFCLAHPKWRLSLQTHKYLGIA